MTELKRIIITGAGGTAGVNFIDSLRDATEKFHLIGTKLDARHLLWADVKERLIIPKYAIRLQPGGEFLALAKNRKKLHCLTFLPITKTIALCKDKFESARIWKRAGIKTLLIQEQHFARFCREQLKGG